MHVVRVVLGCNIAARHAVSAEVASGPARLRLSQRRLPYVNDFDAQLSRAALQQHVTAFQWDGRQKDAIGQISKSVQIPADPHFALDTVVVRREIGIVNGPVLARAIVPVFALKVALGEAPGHGVPGLRLAARPPRALRVHAGFARLHGGDVPIGKLIGHRMGIEVGTRIQLRAALHQRHVHALPGQSRGQRAARRAGPHHHHVEYFLLSHYLSRCITPKGVRYFGSAELTHPPAPRPAGPNPRLGHPQRSRARPRV